MGQAHLSVIPDIVQANFTGPLETDAEQLFGIKQDPRFAEPGVTADLAAEQRLLSGNTKDAFRGKDSRVHARRPLRGIQIKDDTYVSMRIITDTGLPLFQIDSAGREVEGIGDKIGFSFVNTNFIAQTIQEERVEKSQVLETFGQPFVFFFGERPRFVTVQGYLLNTVDFNWRAEWWSNYEDNIRGTKLVERKAKIFLSWDDIVVAGYIMSAAATDLATEPYRIPFQFSFFLTNYFNIGIRGKIPVGHVSPIEELQKASEGLNRGPDAIFNKIFPATSRNEVQTAITGVTNPVRNALSIVQAVSANPSQVFDAPRDLAALGLLRGGVRPSTKFGPLRNNYDEFLGTELDALDTGTPRFEGLSKRNFTQRLISFVPGMNDAIELQKLFGKMGSNSVGFADVKTSGGQFEQNPALKIFDASNFGPGSLSSPFAL